MIISGVADAGRYEKYKKHERYESMKVIIDADKV